MFLVHSRLTQLIVHFVWKEFIWVQTQNDGNILFYASISTSKPLGTFCRAKPRFQATYEISCANRDLCFLRQYSSGFICASTAVPFEFLQFYENIFTGALCFLSVLSVTAYSNSIGPSVILMRKRTLFHFEITIFILVYPGGFHYNRLFNVMKICTLICSQSVIELLAIDIGISLVEF